MITTRQALSNAQMIREGTGRIRDKIATLLVGPDGDGRQVMCLSRPALLC